MSEPPKALQNPYVGPRSFTVEESSYFFGREQDTRDLVETLLSERIVLLHSPSGAGKTSLIRTSLIKAMKDHGFLVHPIIRVNEIVPKVWTFRSTNRYVRSAITSLETEGKSGTWASQTFSTPTLGGYLDQRGRNGLKSASEEHTFVPELLVFDQFEECLTADPLDYEAKAEFFTQLGDVLSARHRWALFAMREEYMAAIGDYFEALPCMPVRRRLDLLSVENATLAIEKPAEMRGARYEPDALERLVDNLRLIADDGSGQQRYDRLIEPVHLQVACLTVWDAAVAALNGAATDHLLVKESHVEDVGDVDGTLQEYYRAAVSAAAEKGGIPEGKIRDWIGNHLITFGTRTQVLKGIARQRGINADAAKVLEDRYIIRIENRRSAVWYELAHDRLIHPVKQDNAEFFFTRSQGDLHRQAAAWVQNGRPKDELLRGKALEKALAMVRQNPDSETPELSDYLESSQAREKKAQHGFALQMAGVAGLALWILSAAYMHKRDEADALADTTRALLRWRDSAESASREARWGLAAARQSGEVLQQSARADQAIKSILLANTPDRDADTVYYFLKPSDPRGAQIAILNLGIPLRLEVGIATTLETNTVGYGRETNLKNVQLVSLALMRAGITLRRVCPSLRGTRGPHAIQVLGSSTAIRAPVVTLDQVQRLGETGGVHCGLPI